MADRSGDQWKMILGGTAIIAVGGYVISLLLAPGDSGPSREDVSGVVERQVLAGVTSSAQPERLWVTKADDRFRKLDQDYDKLQADYQRLERRERDWAKEKDDILSEVNQVVVRIAGEASSAQDRARRAEAESEALKLQLAAMDERLRRQEEAPPVQQAGYSPAPAPASGARLPEGQGTNEFVTANNAAHTAPVARREAAEQDQRSPVNPPVPPQPSYVEFTLEGDTNARKKIENYLPAGSYAPATVISGVDASVGIENQSDPRPVLIRVDGPAVTASTKDGQTQTVDITGCIITAQAIGDLSSERVFPRILAMTCSPEAGEVSEFEVAGFVAGQGKAGVRGQVVSRKGDLIENAAVAGVLTGLAQTVGSIGSTASGDITSDDGTQGLGQILQAGALNAGGEGIASAGDRLAQYYIRRAEQYQPVISLYGGTQVEVVFLKGVKIDG